MQYDSHTIDGLALRQVGVILSSQEAIAIASDDAFNVAIRTLVGGPEDDLKLHTHC
jgi:hypothetical protein